METLQAKQEMIIQVELTSEQKRLYRAVYEKNVSQIAKLAGAKNGEGQLKNIAMQLRKCCNHPFLINGIEVRHSFLLRHRCNHFTPFMVHSWSIH